MSEYEQAPPRTDFSHPGKWGQDHHRQARGIAAVLAYLDQMPADHAATGMLIFDCLIEMGWNFNH